MTPRGLLITRPYEDSLKLAESLRKKHFLPIIEPLLTIGILEEARMPLTHVLTQPIQGVAVTSRHAVTALAEMTETRHVPLYAVGEATAETARNLGFSHVHRADGDATALLSLLRASCRPEAGKLLYARGRHITADLGALLSTDGFSVEQIVVYDAFATRHFSPETKAAFSEDSLLGALFFSRRTAEIFSALIRQEELEQYLPGLEAFCLSPAIAEALNGMAWKARHVAAAPSLAELLALLPTPK